MFTRLSSGSLSRVLLPAVLLALLGTTGAHGALLPSDAPARWKAYIGLDAPVGEAFKARGMQAYREGDLRLAADLLSVARDFLPLDSDVLGRLGFALKQIGRYEEAQDLLFQATIEDSENHLPWLWLGDVQRLLGDYTAAFQSMLTARDLAPASEQESLQNYVNFTEQLGTAVPAWAIFERHRDFAKRHQENRRYRRMIEEYMTALDLAPPLGFTDDDADLKVAWVLNEMGEQYSHLKEGDVAIDYYRRSIASYEKAGSAPDVMRVEQNLATTYSWLADRDPVRKDDHLDRAIEHWREVVADAQEQNNVEYLRYAYGCFLADLVSRHGVAHEETKRVRERVQRELPRRGPVPDFSTAAITYGESVARLAEGDMAGARVVLEMGLPYFRESEYLVDLERAARMQANLARVYLHQDHYARAYEVAGAGRQTLIDLRQFLDADAFSRSTNPETLRHLATVAVQASIKRGKMEDALAAFESYRRQARIDMLGSKIRNEAWRTDYATEAEIIERRIPGLEEDLATAEAERDAYQSDRLNRRLDDDRARMAWLQKAVAFPDASRLSVARIPLLSAQDAPGSLPGDATFLGLVFDDAGGAAIVVTPEGISGTTLDVSEADLRERVQNLRRALDAGDTMTGADEAEALYAALIAPVREQLQGSVLYITVDETLANVPFEALRKGERALADDFTIAYAASMSHLEYSRKLGDAVTEGLRAVLNQENDGTTLGSMLDAFGEKEVHAGDAATEAAVYAASPRRPFLHVSTAADLGPIDAMLSALLLREGDDEDGRLHAMELLTGSLPFDAVVMDIAAPPARDFLRGNAYAAFSEGLLHAGTPTLVTNRWTVPEAVRTAFFDAYYRTLPDEGVGQAVQAGRRAVRAVDPEGWNWASFILLGSAE